GERSDTQVGAGGLDGHGVDELLGAGLVDAAVDHTSSDAGHDAGQGQVPAHVEGLYQAVALTVLGDEAQTGADALTDRLTRDRAAFEGDLTGHDRLTAG